jgi:hypothetical protein
MFHCLLKQIFTIWSKKESIFDWNVSGDVSELEAMLPILSGLFLKNLTNADNSSVVCAFTVSCLSVILKELANGEQKQSTGFVDTTPKFG